MPPTLPLFRRSDGQWFLRISYRPLNGRRHSFHRPLETLCADTAKRRALALLAAIGSL
jgi:hypothetical protein